MTHHTTNESPLSRFANLIFTQSQHRAASAAAIAVLGIVGLFLIAAPNARAEFGLHNLDLTFTQADGSAATQAGSHPFAITNTLAIDTAEDEVLGITVPSGDIRDLTASLPPGLVADRGATRQCTAAEFRPAAGGDPICARATVIGTARVELGLGSFNDALVYNLVPPPGVLARIGFAPVGDAVTVDLGLSQHPPYSGFARLANTPQVIPVFSSELTLWGVPADPAHDAARGGPVDGARRAYLTLPRSCTGPLASSFEVSSWQGGAFAETIFSHGEFGEPLGMSGCERLGFAPSITAEPTSKAASSPTGLDFSLDVKDENLQSPDGEAASDIEKAVVTLPEGFTANPSVAEGLVVCGEEQVERETPSSAPGTGCPEASKIGTVEVETPLLEGQLLKGSLFIATPYENPFGSLLALYVVIKNANLGINVIQPLKVEPDPLTGQLVTTAEEIPQLPFSHFRLHFREGGRSPLISPPRCGAYDGHDPAHEPVKAVLTPWSGAAPITTTSTFQIISGPNEGPCPSGGVAPFHPGFEAGSLNNSAGAYSPFVMRLKRADGEQDMTKFSAVLPPGVVGKIAGVSKCPEAAIAQAKSRTGPHGAQEELDHPSCPASSRIGRTLAGAGVGSQLTYVPGSLYLAGPIGGDPLSVVSITPALAGPFDAGAVVVRVALTLNPATAEVEADGSHSDPIPHILKGIPLNVRDLRVYADKQNFTINPTNCEPSSARATLFGSFLNPLDPADDLPVGLSARYQAANCAALPFKPNLAINLIGGTKRGGHPALTATVTPRPGDANFKSATVTLPHSAFLDQAHIRTICTRVQFAAGAGNGSACPPDSIYGHAKANSPLLEETLEGPVFLRSSSHNLPDLVIALHGIVDINLASRIDSQKGGIRSTFDAIPDAPVSKFVLEMQGAKKGLIVNSTDICKGKHLLKANLTGQNGRLDQTSPPLKAKCKGARKAKRHHHRHAKRAALHHLRAAR